MGKDDFIEVDKNELPDDLSYSGVSGDDYYLSMAHWWSPSEQRTYYNSYLGRWYVYNKKAGN